MSSVALAKEDASARMHHVYIIKSLSDSTQIYKGLTDNVEDRIARHNRKEVRHTSKYAPWKIIFLAGFTSRKQAADFERYLKSGSGIAFMRKRLIETDKLEPFQPR